MTGQLISFRVVDDKRLGDQPVQVVTEDDLEAFIKHLVTLGRAASTRNHYVQLIKAMSRWAVRKGYRRTPFIGDESDVIRRRKEAQRHRRLEQGEEERLLRATGSHLQALIIAALETCCREGVLLSLRWCDVSLARGEMVVRAEHAKDREQRILPISTRLRHVLDMRRNGPELAGASRATHARPRDVAADEHLPQRDASRAARVDAEPGESSLGLQTACKHFLPRSTACSQAGSRH
jgi:integrase